MFLAFDLAVFHFSLRATVNKRFKYFSISNFNEYKLEFGNLKPASTFTSDSDIKTQIFVILGKIIKFKQMSPAVG
jgi:hypothetical protein